VWRIIRDPNIRILIANAKGDNAEAFLTAIKGHFEGNQKLRMYYGDFVGKKWNEGEIVVSKRTNLALKENTIKCAGVGASLVSQHYDLIIPDDVVNETNVTTKEQIDKVKEWWGLSQSLGDGENTDWRIVGTRYHDNDLYGEIIEKNDSSPKPYYIYIRQVIEDGKPLWPYKFNDDHIADIRANQSAYTFSCQYYNDPISDEDAMFRKEQIQYYDDDDLKSLRLNHFVTLDPAIGQDDRNDDSVFCHVAVDEDNNWFVRFPTVGKLTPGKIVDKIFEHDEEIQPKTTGIEGVAFQKVLQYMVQAKSREDNNYIPITELKPNARSKVNRIRGLQPRFENGIIYIRRNDKNTDKFVDQLLRFPTGKHDDMIDALAYMLDIAYPPRRKDRERKAKRRPMDSITNY
jgi:predicted phage terminase large subunit-like protein